MLSTQPKHSASSMTSSYGTIGRPVMIKSLGRDPKRTSLEFARRLTDGKPEGLVGKDITLGYAAFMLAMGLGHVNLGLYFFAPQRAALLKELLGSKTTAGGEPFVYLGRGRREVSLSYRAPPPEALDDAEGMLPWARLAVEAARRARAERLARARERALRGARGAGRSGSSTGGGATSPSGRTRRGRAKLASRRSRGRPR